MNALSKVDLFGGFYRMTDMVSLFGGGFFDDHRTMVFIDSVAGGQMFMM